MHFFGTMVIQRNSRLKKPLMETFVGVLAIDQFSTLHKHLALRNLAVAR